MEFEIWKPLAGLALFLLAMSVIEESIRGVAGASVKSFLARNTHHPLRGVLSGTFATALLQSSSLVGLLVLAFVGARIMKLKNALLVIFGANLGTTATGWIVATIGFKLDLETLAMPLIALGGLFWVVLGEKRAANYGRLFLGIGLLLLALQFMKSSVSEAESLIDPAFFAQFNALEFLVFGAVFSAIVQSSSAAMVVTLSALNSGLLTLEAAAAIMIGADLGTTTTVMFGAIRGSASKKRVALGHVIFNAVTDAIAFVLLLPLVAVVQVLGDPLLSLVAFHSLFNVLGVFIWTPMVGKLAGFLEGRFETDSGRASAHLDKETGMLPETALPALLDELEHLTGRIVDLNATVFAGQYKGETEDRAREFLAAYPDAKKHEGELLQFALDLDVASYASEQRDQLESALQTARNLLLSSKLCKDSLHDLQELADYHPHLYGQIFDVEAEFYDGIRDIAEAYSDLDVTQVEALAETTRSEHDRLHEHIHTDIQADVLPSNLVSAVLNVNRTLFNSNIALLTALAALSRGRTRERIQQLEAV